MRSKRTKKFPMSFIGTQRLKKYVTSMCGKDWLCYHITEKRPDGNKPNIECWIRNKVTKQVITLMTYSSNKEYSIYHSTPRQVARNVKYNHQNWSRIDFGK